MISYIEQSKDVVANLVPAGIQDYSFKSSLGEGNDAAVWSLGEVSQNGQDAAHVVAIKCPRGSLVTPFDIRLVNELTQASILAEHSALIKDALPSFMGLIVVTRELAPSVKALLTEDLSRDGTVNVTHTQLPTELRRNLLGSFGITRFDTIFDEDALDGSNVFDVDGQHKILDLTPPPIKRSARVLRGPLASMYNRVHAEAEAALDSLTVTIDERTELGMSILGYTQGYKAVNTMYLPN